MGRNLALFVSAGTALCVLFSLRTTPPRLVHAAPDESQSIEPATPGTDPRGGPNQGVIDLVTGSLPGVSHLGRSGNLIGIGVATTVCNKGTEIARWQALPAIFHPVIAQNFYRLKNDRFEQIGQSWVKHGFAVIPHDLCGYGCTSGCSSSQLCGGCSDSYTASLNGDQYNISSRAWIQPFSGFFISGSNRHTGHVHDGVSHRVIIDDAEIAQDQNGNNTAIYYAEGQYVHPDEYIHAPSLAARTMLNNVTYRRFNVTGVAGGAYTFAANGDPVPEAPAITAWPGAAFFWFEPAPGEDGIGLLAWKVTREAERSWRYEYALYNQNLDRAINGLSIPLGAGAQTWGVTFRAPANHPAWRDDGTVGDAGFSSVPWNAIVNADSITWLTDPVEINPNANAIRWGTLYNFTLHADQPPRNANATVAFFKTNTGDLVATQGPSPACVGDIDRDRDVDLQDLSYLLAMLGGCGFAGCNGADLDGDDDVDLGDLAMMLSAFGMPCPQ